MTVNRDTARRYTARARVAALVLLAGGVAVLALPLPFLRPAASTAAISSEDPVPEAPAEAGKQPPPIDLDRAISTLWGFGLPPVEEPVAEAKPAAGTPGTTPKPAQAAAPAVTPGGWRYIGNIMGPRGMHALLEREGRQRLVRVGDQLDDARVTAIDAASVSIDDGRGPKSLKITDRASRWSNIAVAPTVRPATPPSRASTPSPANPAGVVVNRPGMTPRSPTGLPQRDPYNTQLTDEEREKYERERLELIEKYRESGEEPPPPEDGGSR